MKASTLQALAAECVGKPHGISVPIDAPVLKRLLEERDIAVALIAITRDNAVADDPRLWAMIEGTEEWLASDDPSPLDVPFVRGGH